MANWQKCEKSQGGVTNKSSSRYCCLIIEAARARVPPMQCPIKFTFFLCNIANSSIISAICRA